jgi:hypothetical protein
MMGITPTARGATLGARSRSSPPFFCQPSEYLRETLAHAHERNDAMKTADLRSFGPSIRAKGIICSFLALGKRVYFLHVFLHYFVSEKAERQRAARITFSYAGVPN